jgi:hypothetical protein
LQLLYKHSEKGKIMTTTTRNAPLAETHSGGIWRQVGVVAATIFALTLNILASTLPLNGQSTGEISDRFPVYFVPAGYVFSIWGVIYIGWIAYNIYQAGERKRHDPLLRAIAPWYMLSALANGLWIVAWHYNYFAVSLGIMLVLLVSLIVVYVKLAARPPVSRMAFWALYLPFSVYLAWVSVATIANATSTFYDLGWTAESSGPLWAAIMIGVGTVLALAFSWLRADIGFVAVFVWAFVGIYVKHSDTPLVAWSALIGAGLLVLSLLISVPRRVAQRRGRGDDASALPPNRVQAPSR